MQDALLREDAEAYDADRDGTEGHPFKPGEVKYYQESSPDDMEIMESRRNISDKPVSTTLIKIGGGSANQNT